jgi:type I restriction enzyme S subunit
MKKYSKYISIDSGYINEIPNHWEYKKLKYLCKIYNGNSLKDDEKILYSNADESSVPYISTKDIEFGTQNINYDNGLRIPSNSNFKIATKDSFLLCIEGGSAGKKMGYLTQDVYFVNKLACFNSLENVNAKYLYYYIRSVNFQNQFQLSMSGLIGGVAISLIRNFDSIKPPLSEQDVIVEYLDDKTNEIDKLIQNKIKLIKLLKEERSIIINNAVTKGLNDKVKLKPSGIEWIGYIPENWSATPLKYLGTTQNGISAGAEYFGSGYPFVSYGDVYKNMILPKSVNGLANSTDKDRANFSVNKGDVFFTRTSETIDEIGLASTCLETIKNAVFAGFLIRFRPFENVLFEGFSKYYFRSEIHRTFFIKEMNIVTRASLSQGLLKRLLVLLPDLKEQKEISDFLDVKTKEIENIISKTEKEIELLNEYKTALISEVVTGKVDVREEVLA